MKNKLKLYFNAAQSAKIGIWDHNLKKSSTYWDAVTKCILEVPEDFIPVLGSGIGFYTEGKNRDRIKFLIDQAINQGIPFSETFQITTAKNNIKYVECICQVVFKKGKPRRLLGTFQDITKEQNLINEMQLSVEKFSSIFSSANDAIFIFDISNGNITDCNPRISELTGYATTELIGLHHSKLFPANYNNEIENILNQNTEEDNYTVKESYIQTKSGTILPVEIASGKKFNVRDKNYLVCFFRDISERKSDESYMNMLSLAVSETTDTIIIADPNGKTVWANKAYLELTGFSLDEIVGNTPGFLSKGPETNQHTTDIMRQAIKDKKSIKVTILNYKKNKEKYWYDLNINPVFDKENTLINYIGVGRDITVRKEKELELNKLLEVTNDQNNKLFNFAHIISHNIRSHSSNLSMVLEVMKDTHDVEEKISYIDLFEEATDKLSQTIEFLNEIITIQKSNNIEKKEIRLKDEIEKIKNTLSLIIKESKITVIDNIPEDLTLCVIPAYLESILLNLFTNAIKYKSPNRTTILEIDYEVKEQYTIISFKDNGLGINLEKNGHKIFGMYKTFHDHSDARGIGLFITKNQIEAMKGKIEVESEVGVGSTFKIYLNEK
ncbi:PAS domain-containing sensor histidine kinase [Flavobacterium granuli]|uniref:histidine kinase n=1 Tax=Flavobacterium granuli TaxID=280093 RepID=A0A1M5LJ40_9FLAO|nr:PAS domain-containing sensor histidine kinase [Flavobacterium granuli]PRZ23997.1 PAS domain S-box-containing protein [Flavobacterium granuli]SHG64976.1 PAS domain S-box-containing protein [Flavobacterium granuli]